MKSCTVTITIKETQTVTGYWACVYYRGKLVTYAIQEEERDTIRQAKQRAEAAMKTDYGKGLVVHFRVLELGANYDANSHSSEAPTTKERGEVLRILG